MAAACPQVEKAPSIDVNRVKSPSQLLSDYGTTPGGTMFATTPGGTRIMYDRSFLLECRNSPLAHSTLANLPRIPGVTCPAEKVGGDPKSETGQDNSKPEEMKERKKAESSPGATGDDSQFEMDI